MPILLTDRQRLPDPLAAMERLPRGSQVIIRDYDHPNRREYAQKIVQCARRNYLQVLIARDTGLALQLRADGVHFPEHFLARARGYRRQFPQSYITGAVHSAAAIAQTNRLNCFDALLLSPVLATASHPGARPLGIVRFTRLRQLTKTPVYALGGITEKSQQLLRGSKLAGIAGITVFQGNRRT